MPWKTDEESESLAVGEDGNPIWIYEDGENSGREVAADFNRMSKKLGDVTAESVGRKNKIRELEEKFKSLNEIENIDDWFNTANEALQTVANYNDKELIAAGEAEKIKQGVIDSYEQKLATLKDTSDTAVTNLQQKLTDNDTKIHDLIIRSAFDRSEYLRDQTVLLPDMAYKYFGDRFGVDETESGLVGFAKDKESNKIMSLMNPGEFAAPDEAIELLVLEHPQRDRIIKKEASGSGTTNSSESKPNPQKHYQDSLKSKDFVGAIAGIREASG